MAVQSVFQKTKDAYSFNRYAKSAWRGAIQYLRSIGLSDRQIEAVLRSKHMRWAADNSSAEYGQVPIDAVEDYFKRYPEFLSRKELTYLVNG